MRSTQLLAVHSRDRGSACSGERGGCRGRHDIGAVGSPFNLAEVWTQERPPRRRSTGALGPFRRPTGRIRTIVPSRKGLSPLSTPREWLAVKSMPEGGEFDLHGVLSPDGIGTWYLVKTPLAPRSVCGQVLLCGSRLEVWEETPEDDRCLWCLGLADEPF